MLLLYYNAFLSWVPIFHIQMLVSLHETGKKEYSRSKYSWRVQTIKNGRFTESIWSETDKKMPWSFSKTAVSISACWVAVHYVAGKASDGVLRPYLFLHLMWQLMAELSGWVAITGSGKSNAEQVDVKLRKRLMKGWSQSTLQLHSPSRKQAFTACQGGGFDCGHLEAAKHQAAAVFSGSPSRWKEMPILPVTFRQMRHNIGSTVA
jgi:hypothetical protein